MPAEARLPSSVDEDEGVGGLRWCRRRPGKVVVAQREWRRERARAEGTTTSEVVVDADLDEDDDVCGRRRRLRLLRRAEARLKTRTAVLEDVGDDDVVRQRWGRLCRRRPREVVAGSGQRRRGRGSRGEISSSARSGLKAGA